MKQTDISLINLTRTFKHSDLVHHHYRGPLIDRPLAFVLILLLLPCLLLNTAIALITKKNVFLFQHKTDALGRTLKLRFFNCGICLKTAVLIDIFLGKIGFCGIPLTHRVSPEIQLAAVKQLKSKAGIFSLYDLHVRTGLTVTSKEQLLEQQLNGTFTDYVLLIVKSFLCIVLYGQSQTKNKDQKSKNISLFGLKVKNTSMDEAVNWITSTHKKGQEQKTQIVFFVNVHSINLSFSDSKFFDQLSKADALFADGSGMRLAARKAGFLLNGNNNGTDMLPRLCQRCIEKNQSLYFLGARPGVAQKAANELSSQFPGLNIAGTEHGYTEINSTEGKNSDPIVAAINKSGCDVLLVAMGSPLQEKWLLEHRDQLQCKTALAVGGLFDFYSGHISRSPVWLREIGMEWVWRLIQEPKIKFNRYVIGNFLFLYRTFFVGLVKSGIK
jgi:N-acetylglucosaminyldiphosphoundecaprenol N-acetyl-beta-D-mannosaminyltransferase